MKKKEIIKNLEKKVSDLELEVRLHNIKDEYIEKGKDSKCFFTALANTFGCAAEISQAINDHKKVKFEKGGIDHPNIKNNEPVMVGEKETEQILKNSGEKINLFKSYSTRIFPHTHKEQCIDSDSLYLANKEFKSQKKISLAKKLREITANLMSEYDEIESIHITPRRYESNKSNKIHLIGIDIKFNE